MPKPDLCLDWCKYDAARYAVEHWHYSKRMPAGRLLRIGVWEGGAFRGVILFGRGANRHLVAKFGLPMQQGCELVRIALREHEHAVTRMVAIALKMLKGHAPGLRLVVSYADPQEGHIGAIYQAGNWIYVGAADSHVYMVNGVPMHGRTLSVRYGTGGQRLAWLRENIDPKAERVIVAGKHKYVMPLDPEMRRQVVPMAKPYPKRTNCAGSIGSDVPAAQAGEGGASPTPALQESDGQE